MRDDVKIYSENNKYKNVVFILILLLQNGAPYLSVRLWNTERHTTNVMDSAPYSCSSMKIKLSSNRDLLL